MKGITAMRVLAQFASIGLALAAAPAFAQATTPARPAAPATQTQRPATQAPQAQRPAPPPAPAPAVATTPPPAPLPFPAGSKVAYVNLPLLTQMSADGKAAAARFQAEEKKKMADAEAKANKMKADQDRLDTSGSIMSADARANLQKDIERQQREGERFEQDAQTELNDLQDKLQAEYNRKLIPVLDQLAKDFGLDLLFSGTDAGLIWANPALDLTFEAVKRLDAAPTPPPAPAAPAPAAAAPKR
jgi:outer membrane protein